MFDNSKIDNSNLASGKPIINYDVVNLEKDGFQLRYDLNPKNPVYNQVINECKRQNIGYKIMAGIDNKKHIWIKR